MKMQDERITAVKKLLAKEDATQNEKMEFFILEAELINELGKYEYDRQVYGELKADTSREVEQDIIDRGGVVKSYHNEIAEIARRNLE